MYIIIYSIIVIYLFIGCGADQCLMSLGSPATENRTIPLFDKIIIEDDIEVILEQDSTVPPYVMIEAPKNLMPRIKTIVNTGTLTLKNENKCNWVRSYNYSIKARVNLAGSRLQRIEHYGYKLLSCAQQLILYTLWCGNYGNADIKLDVDMNNLIIFLRGSGEAYVTGKMVELNLNLYDVGGVYAYSAQAAYVWIWHSGIRNCYVSPEIGMLAVMRNSGNVYANRRPIEFFNLDRKREGNVFFE